MNIDKEDFIPHLPVITYVGNNFDEDRENGACNIGPLVTISTDGILTEDNVSFDNQMENYNYGSIFDDQIDKKFIQNGSKIVLPLEFDEENAKVLAKILDNKK